MPTIGLLYPGSSAEDDFPRLEQRLGTDLRLPVVHTSVGEDAHRVDALLDLGSTEQARRRGPPLVEEHRPDSIMWACTSGSFVFGWQGAHDQVRALQARTGLPTSSTSLAFVEALPGPLDRAGERGRVLSPTTWPNTSSRFLDRGGISVTALGSHGIVTAAEVGTLGYEQVEAIATGADVSGGAEAVLIPDTAMHSLQWIDKLEAAVGLPVLTANQVTVWQGLRLLGDVPRYEALGTLFRTPSRG